jgi:microcystin-dependent protein
MPSTFTTSGVELIADGEQSGAWGQTTNLNLQIIDRMISQAGTITLSGTTHTLTVSNGALSDGQYGVLVFAGSPSGTNTVTINPNTAQRTFIARNTTSQSVVLTQGSGGNVTIVAGATRIVYSNGAGAGAAVVDISNTLAADTAAKLQTARTIGGVSFDGSANINLPGVNQAGNQNTTGSAASLTTARTINGVSFNGTANITLPTVNDSGDQNVAGVKTFTTALAVTGTSKAAGRFYGGTTNPTESTRLNYDGALHATSFVGNGAGLTGIVSIPSGLIAVWSGSVASIPAGWVLCDGANGTPNLRDRFVVGAGSSYAVDATGGSNTVTLATTEIPGHTHTVSGTTASDGAHTHNVSGNTAAGGDHSHNFNANSGNAGDHAHNGSTSNTGAHQHNSDNVPSQNVGSLAPDDTPSRRTAAWAEPRQNVQPAALTSSAGAHSHNFTTANAGTHSHNFNANTGNSGNHTHTLSGTADSAGAHTHTFSATTGSTGGGSAHENRPPFYALAYIMKT